MTVMPLPDWVGQHAVAGSPRVLELCVEGRAVAEVRWSAEAHRRGEGGWTWRRRWPVPEPGFVPLALASTSPRGPAGQCELEAELASANRAIRYVLAILACDAIDHDMEQL
jgi:hypothetical protein